MEEKSTAAKMASDLLTTHALFLQSQHIACYLPAKDEMDTSFIIHAIWTAQKQCYLPRLVDGQAKSMEFVSYDEKDPLQANQYGIAEPAYPAQVIEPEKLDIVLMPLVAFDRQRGRLGMGGGYYDRTFQFLSTQSKRHPQLIGLAFAIQEAEKLPIDAWDVPLDGVLTENELLIF